MRYFAILLSATLLAGAGCKPPKLKPDKPTERAGGLISQVHDKVKETVTMVEMHDLHLMMSADALPSGAPPAPETVKEYAKKENPKLAKLLEDGIIVLTGIKQREGLWAYEKDAPEKGGWIVTHSGQSKVTLDEFKKLQGK